MKNPVILILSLIVLVLLLVGPVWGTTTGTINVTVTPKLISLSVSPSSYSYGTLGLSETATTTIPFAVENTGNVDEDFDVKGFDTADWLLGEPAGADIYQHDWKNMSGGGYTALTKSAGVSAATSVGTGNSENFKFQLHTPTSSDATDTQSPNVTFTALES